MLLSGAVNAMVADGTGAGTIVTDDVDGASGRQCRTGRGARRGRAVRSCGCLHRFGRGRRLDCRPSTTAMARHPVAGPGSRQDLHAGDTRTRTTALHDQRCRERRRRRRNRCGRGRRRQRGADGGCGPRTSSMLAGDVLDRGLLQRPGRRPGRARSTTATARRQPLHARGGPELRAFHPICERDAGFPVTVTVTDDDGGTDSDTATVTVEDVVVPALTVGDVELAEGDAGQRARPSPSPAPAPQRGRAAPTSRRRTGRRPERVPPARTPTSTAWQTAPTTAPGTTTPTRPTTTLMGPVRAATPLRGSRQAISSFSRTPAMAPRRRCSGAASCSRSRTPAASRVRHLQLVRRWAADLNPLLAGLARPASGRSALRDRRRRSMRLPGAVAAPVPA